MSKKLVDFLIEQYGQRVDFPQPLVNTGNDIMQKQLALVDKRITKGRRVALFWAILGVMWIILSSLSKSEPVIVTNLFRVGLGLFYVLSALFLLNQLADLKKKKVILETLLLLNETEE